MSASVTLHCDAAMTDDTTKDCPRSFTGGIHAPAEFIRKAATAQEGWSSYSVTETPVFPTLANPSRTYTYDFCKEHTQ